MQAEQTYIYGVCCKIVKEVISCSKTCTCATNFLSISHIYTIRFVELMSYYTGNRSQPSIIDCMRIWPNRVIYFVEIRISILKWNTSISFFEVTLRRNPWFSMNWKWKTSVSLEVNLIGSISRANIQQIQNWKDKNQYTCKNLLGIASLDSSRAWELSFPNSLIRPSL